MPPITLPPLFYTTNKVAELTGDILRFENL